MERDCNKLTSLESKETCLKGVKEEISSLINHPIMESKGTKEEVENRKNQKKCYYKPCN